jgi:hypothetical protein
MTPDYSCKGRGCQSDQYTECPTCHVFMGVAWSQHRVGQLVMDVRNLKKIHRLAYLRSPLDVFVVTDSRFIRLR